SSQVTKNKKAWLEIFYDVYQPISGVHLFCHVYDDKKRLIFHAGDRDAGADLDEVRQPGRYCGSMPLPLDFLRWGEYTVEIGFGVPLGTIYDRAKNALSFVVIPDPTLQRPKYLDQKPGMAVRDVPWKTYSL